MTSIRLPHQTHTRRRVAYWATFLMAGGVYGAAVIEGLKFIVG